MAIRGASIRAFENNRTLCRLARLIGVVLLLLLGIYHQPYYPSSWLDEGFMLQGPMNLVRYGKYAMRSLEGFRVLDQPLVANGPGVVLPITISFAIFGIGLLQARLVMVVYLVLTAVVFFILSERLYGSPAAWVSSWLLLSVPWEGFLQYGRWALGNVPALGYFLMGYLCWLTSLERDSSRHALGAGFMFGLAMVTKGQYGLLIPTLLIVAFADLIYHRTIGLRKIALVLLAALGCLGMWYGAQLMLVGVEDFGQHLEAIRSSARVTVLAFSPLRIPRNIWYLIRSGLPLFVLPGLVYTAWSARKPGLDSSRRLLLFIFVSVWLLWYVFASTGWHRYAFDAYAVGMLCTGRFVVDTILFLREKNGASSNESRMGTAIRLGALLLVAAILVWGIGGFAGQVRRILVEVDRSCEKLGDYLQNQVSPQAVIESWEWEVDLLADLNYHHPPNIWVDRMTAVDRYHEELEVVYDPFAYQPEYLIDGPMSKRTGLYAPYLADGCCTLVFSAGLYDLYEVNRHALDQ